MSTAAKTPGPIADLRISANLSLAEAGKLLAEQIGRDRPYTHARMSQIEDGDLKDVEIMEALARMYSVPFSTIREGIADLRNNCK